MRENKCKQKERIDESHSHLTENILSQFPTHVPHFESDAGDCGEQTNLRKIQYNAMHENFKSHTNLNIQQSRLIHKTYVNRWKWGGVIEWRDKEDNKKSQGERGRRGKLTIMISECFLSSSSEWRKSATTEVGETERLAPRIGTPEEFFNAWSPCLESRSDGWTGDGNRGWIFTTGCSATHIARCPNNSEVCVSLACRSHGPTLISKDVRLFPPRNSWKRLRIKNRRQTCLKWTRLYTAK